MLHELDDAEAATTQEADGGEVGEANLLIAGGAVVRGRHRRCAATACAEVPELLERKQHVEGLAVHGEGLGCRRHHPNRGGARLVVQQRALAEDLGVRGRAHQAGLFLPVLEDLNFALGHDVEAVADFALLDDVLTSSEGHFNQGLRDGLLLLLAQRLEHLHPIEVCHCLRRLLIVARGQHLLEVLPVDGPDDRRLPGDDCGRSRRQVQQSELAEAPALPNGRNRHRQGIRTLPLGVAQGREQHLEGALLNDEEAVGVQAALGDDLLALRHHPLLRRVGHLAKGALAQEAYGALQVFVVPNRVHDQLVLRRRLRRPRGAKLVLATTAVLAATAAASAVWRFSPLACGILHHGLPVREHQAFVQVQAPEVVPGDA
mmetsp:Transcript_29545/g.84978  ORF Transcript_29545/g.84978 Transcript_29545/m.84978 type:complete len:374 (-) Transcript_29545:22-1143(-)